MLGEMRPSENSSVSDAPRRADGPKRSVVSIIRFQFLALRGFLEKKTLGRLKRTMRGREPWEKFNRNE